MAAVFRGVRERQQSEADRLVALAWTIAALQRADKLPPLSKLLDRRSPQQTPEERRALVLAWAEAHNSRRESGQCAA